MTARKKAFNLGVRPWLAVDAAGEANIIDASKQAIMQRTGLPARDLRMLDPQLSYPSTVLGRERAVVVNLEHIKAIITANEVLLLNSQDHAVAPFVEELRRRLHHWWRHSLQGDGNGSSEDSVDARLSGRSSQDGDIRSNGDLGDAQNTGCSLQEESMQGSSSKEKPSGEHGDVVAGAEMEGKRKPELVSGHRPTSLPFEFVALEACLEAACSCLENEATTLEKEAHPALDKLTSKISTLNLERVRQIKSRLVAITGRVQKVRDELEHLLDDDGDMAEMYLTKKSMQQSTNSSPHSSMSDQCPEVDDGRFQAEILSEDNDSNNIHEADSRNVIHPYKSLASNAFNGDSHGTRTCSTRSSRRHLDVSELEMLLEAYFVQIDGTLNKLSTLREYVDDTEDYINIMLDDKQNHLLQMGVVLTTATLIVSAFVAMVGIFGMNIQVDLFDKNKSGMREFLWTVGGGTAGSLVLYVISIAWCKHRRLLE